MWLITNLGFFSIVESPDDEYEEQLTVQSHRREDLDRLRDCAVPRLGPSTESESTEYLFQAKCSREELRAAFSELVGSIDYDNLCDVVKAQQGSQRFHLYFKVEHLLRELQSSQFSGDYDDSGTKATISYGGVLMDYQRGVLLRKPTNEFDGYAWTFAKGRHKPDRTPEETALHEVRAKTGYDAEIIAKIPGRFEGGHSVSEYFVMRPLGTPSRFDESRTEEIQWASLDEAADLLGQTRNQVGLRRDQCVLEAVQNLLQNQATSIGWKLHPMPERAVRLPLRMRFSRSEVARLQRGNIPREMEDRWYVYFHDDWVNFHRSWTGFCIYKLRLEVDGDCYRIAEAWVNRDREQYASEDLTEDESLLVSVLYWTFRIGSPPAD